MQNEIPVRPPVVTLVNCCRDGLGAVPHVTVQGRPHFEGKKLLLDNSRSKGLMIFVSSSLSWPSDCYCSFRLQTTTVFSKIKAEMWAA